MSVLFGFCSAKQSILRELIQLLKGVPTIVKPVMYGANWTGSATEFRVWAPHARGVALHLIRQEPIAMGRSSDGTYVASLTCHPGDRYFYIVDDSKPVPDPVSRLLPQGVHGPTEIVDPDAFTWHDAHWPGLDLSDYLIYELHAGTFTPQGTFDAIIGKLPYLKALGISVIELMPVAAFPGTRNWGYDGVSLYAVQASYGGPDGLKRLVDAAHAAGLAVMLDIVYNHLGNEGNYLRLFGPYFTNRHHTPWGDAINYDGPGCEGVRRFIVENALYWIREYHLDGLRLDAVQTIHDDSRVHILAEVQQHVQTFATELGRRVCVIAETDENDPKLVRPRNRGGYALDAVWSDDFHHSVHTVLTGEHEGYYQDFGERRQIVKALNEGFVYQGEHFKFWGSPRGQRPEGMSAPQHVICIQNHDQVGNRAKGERLDTLVPRGAHKLVSALLLLSPHTPLLFMGEEYGERAPFQFFTDYTDPVLQKAVSEGRRKEFEDFTWDEVPDPQAAETFERSKLTWPSDASSRAMLDWYRQLIALRRQFVTPSQRTCHAELRNGDILMQVPADSPTLLVIAEFPESRPSAPGEGWELALESDRDGYRVRVFTR
jgi:maltooligosyltrehalose trehalohydrolase